MRLSQLVESVDVLGMTGSGDVEIEGITHDSRQVQPGWLFVAVQGHAVNGADFIADALSSGAVAVVSESQVKIGASATHIQVPHARRALAELANAFHGDLSHVMKIVGITGTNGKTTTAYMTRDLLRGGGFLPGLLGTVAYEVGGQSIPASRTTPEATEIHAMFHKMKDAGCDSAVMEVSSHAIAQQRVHGIEYSIRVFTNLTQDHLDYHKNMEAYFDVKAELFRSGRDDSHSAVINIDDRWGCRLAEDPKVDIGIITYGFDERAMVRATHAKMDAHGTRFRVRTPWGRAKIKLQLLGRFNIHNALAALAVGGLAGIPLKTMVQTFAHIQRVPGRLELVTNRKRRKVFVDYAHTDDALRNVLETLREICKGRLIVVFGCGGDRDSGKRILMGRVAAELADFSIITADNPRTEDPESIAADIVEGFAGRKSFKVLLDRREAIETGIRGMNRRDILLVAGKGHETYQETMDTIVPFDDREVVQEIFS